MDTEWTGLTNGSEIKSNAGDQGEVGSGSGKGTSETYIGEKTICGTESGEKNQRSDTRYTDGADGE